MIACGVQYCCVGKVQDSLLKFKIALAIILLHVVLATSDTTNIVTSRSTAEKSSGTSSEESPIFTLITYPINASATTSDTSSAVRTLSALKRPNHTETTNNPEFNFSTTVAESSIVTFITYPINASDTTSLERTSPEDRTLSIWPEANQTVCVIGSVTFNYSEKSNNASGNVVRIDDVTTSDKVTKFIPFTTPTLQESKISEFNKTLQDASESSVMECAAENQSISICKFLIKLTNPANISKIIASLKDRTEIVQIELCSCSALWSSSTTAKELQKLQCDGKDPIIYTIPSKLGPPPSLGASSTKISNDFSGQAFHHPVHLPFTPHFTDKPSRIPTVPPGMPFTSTITQAASPPVTTTIPPATSSPVHTTRISPAMPFTKSTTISLPTSPPKLAVPSTVSSTETSSVAPVSSTEPTITTPPGIHSTTASQAIRANNTTGNILDNLSNITHAASNSSEVESIVSKLENALLDQSIEPKVAREMVDTISNLLNVPYSVLSPMSKRIIKIVDAIGLKLNFSTESINFTSPALALAVTKVNSSSFSKMSFTVQDSSDLQISLGDQAPINSVGAIALPSSLLTNLPSEHKLLASRITFNFFEKTTPFQDPSLKNISLISNVISSSVANLTLSDLKANVTVTLQNIMPNLDNLTVRCAFWDFNENGGKGGWSYEGCMVKERRANETVCTCNHLTSFGVLLDLSRNTTLPPIQALVLTFITYIGCGLSAIFLSITLVTYIAFEKIRRDYPSKILIQLCAALLLLNIVFLVDSWIALYNIQGLCITVAVFLHYFLLVSFTWMGLEAFHMYLALVKVFNTYVRKYILKFCIVGWGVPLIVVVIVLAITPNNYGLGSYGKFPNGTPDEFCWINNNIVFYITVVGYFCMIFLLNISMFIVVLIQLCRIKKKKQLGTQRKTTIHDLRSVAGLTFLLGITWGFAFFAWGPVNLVFMYLFAIFNTLQGFFIFIFYCVAKENVRKQWRRYLCCGKFRLAENSDWSRTATNGLKKQTVNQGVSSSSNSLQSNCNSTNSTTLLVNNDYSVLTNGNGNISSEKNGVSFSVQNGDVCLHDFSGKQLIFHEKDDADHKTTRVSLRRTSKRGSLHFIKQM